MQQLDTLALGGGPMMAGISFVAFRSRLDLPQWDGVRRYVCMLTYHMFYMRNHRERVNDTFTSPSASLGRQSIINIGVTGARCLTYRIRSRASLSLHPSLVQHKTSWGLSRSILGIFRRCCAEHFSPYDSSLHCPLSIKCVWLFHYVWPTLWCSLTLPGDCQNIPKGCY